MRPLLALQAARLQRQSFDGDVEALVKGVARSIALARGDAVDLVKGTVPPAARSSRKGQINVDAKYVNGAPEGWFKPGAGKTEWFKDHEDGPEILVVPSGGIHDGITTE